MPSRTESRFCATARWQPTLWRSRKVCTPWRRPWASRSSSPPREARLVLAASRCCVSRVFRGTASRASTWRSRRAKSWASEDSSDRAAPSSSVRSMAPIHALPDAFCSRAGSFPQVRCSVRSMRRWASFPKSVRVRVSFSTFRSKQNLSVSSPTIADGLALSTWVGSILPRTRRSLLRRSAADGRSSCIETSSRSARELSGGNQQKVVRRALVARRSRDVLLLDEPSRGVDLGARRRGARTAAAKGSIPMAERCSWRRHRTSTSCWRSATRSVCSQEGASTELRADGASGATPRVFSLRPSARAA